MTAVLHRGWLWTVMVVATVVAVAEWLRHTNAVWPVVIGVLALLSLVLHRGWRDPAWTGLIVVLVALALVMLVSQRNLLLVRDHWPEERERLVADASSHLADELKAALRRSDRLAQEGVAHSSGDRAAAFGALANALPSSGPDFAVAVLEPTGTPWAWAGRHRVLPAATGDSIAVRSDGYYVLLETRRHSPAGRIVVASVLIWAHPVAPQPGRSLSSQFALRTGVALRVYPPGAAPRTPDVFDYAEPTTAGPRLLFSVQPVPPDQATQLDRVQTRAGRLVGWLVLAMAIGGLVGTSLPLARLSILGAVLWLVLHSPFGALLGFDDLFSPATFFRKPLGPFASSAGVLGFTSAVLVLLGVRLWRRPLPRRWWLKLLGVILLLGAPYLVTELARGIAPPLSGVRTSLWVTWQVVLALATSAVIVVAAACFRDDHTDANARSIWPTWLGAVLALAAAVIGLFVWVPGIGWPDWYTFLWTPALLLVALPAPRWTSLVGTALVAGSAAALVTWGAELNGRMGAAQQDLARLGETEDPLSEPWLERLAEQVDTAPLLQRGAQMYAIWRASYLSDQDYPVRLGLWGPDASPRSVLALDSLDLPRSLEAALIRGLEPAQHRAVVRIPRSFGFHYVLMQRQADSSIFTVAIGPRTRLLPPTRLSRLLRPPPDGAPLYEMTLSPPLGAEEIREITGRWQRDGWHAHRDRVLAGLDGSRRVHAAVSLGDPDALVVRGALLVILDAVGLGGLWLLSGFSTERLRRRVSLRRAARSFQVRLAVMLALFFVIPATGFALWNFSRFDEEAGRSRDLLIAQVLRDAGFAAGALLRAPTELLATGLEDLSNQLDADLALYSGGVLTATSAPILQDLALVEPLLDPRVFLRLGLSDDLAITRNGTTYMAPVRVGYRVVRSGPPGGVGILAAPQVADDWFRAQSQRDLAFVLLLSTLAGIAAAIVIAQLVARALSRPVADLRQSALAVGRGLPLPASRTPPAEFEEVFGAFGRMAADIQSSQRALEEARRRTDAVLANVATGVVALGASGEVLLANPRAREMLGHAAESGTPFISSLPDGWEPLGLAIISRDGSREGELEAGGRRYRYQLERLGAEPGVVLALNDLTDITQAERVLAWGEMAQQVAHEIKNPLTPLRLGVQHLQRAYRDRRGDFDATLETTAARILAEIDRLDIIARGFSRFGLPVEEQAPLESLDLAAIAREVGELYRLAGGGVQVVVEAKTAVFRPVHRDEVKEVMGNLLENARDAGARRVTISVTAAALEVRDDGSGIPPDLLPRIFEPRFSTTTSGAGLGLAIVKRLVATWGADVSVDSESGRGTVVTVRWNGPPVSASGNPA